MFEIAGPSDWTDVLDAYPLDVTGPAAPTGGEPPVGTGSWQIPDWAAVSHDYDAVHLTVIGHLASAGRVLPTSSGQTVLAVFDPDLNLLAHRQPHSSCTTDYVAKSRAQRLRERVGSRPGRALTHPSLGARHQGRSACVAPRPIWVFRTRDVMVVRTIHPSGLPAKRATAGVAPAAGQ